MKLIIMFLEKYIYFGLICMFVKKDIRVLIDGFCLLYLKNINLSIKIF